MLVETRTASEVSRPTLPRPYLYVWFIYTNTAVRGRHCLLLWIAIILTLVADKVGLFIGSNFWLLSGNCWWRLPRAFGGRLGLLLCLLVLLLSFLFLIPFFPCTRNRLTLIPSTFPKILSTVLILKHTLFPFLLFFLLSLSFLVLCLCHNIIPLCPKHFTCTWGECMYVQCKQRGWQNKQRDNQCHSHSHVRTHHFEV